MWQTPTPAMVVDLALGASSILAASVNFGWFLSSICVVWALPIIRWVIRSFTDYLSTFTSWMTSMKSLNCLVGTNNELKSKPDGEGRTLGWVIGSGRHGFIVTRTAELT